MIATKYRVSRTEINYVLKKGDQFTSRLFLIRAKKNTEQFSRYRVIVSKKIAKDAVTRNLLRRRVYEAIRLNLPLETATVHQHFDLIFIPKKYLVDAKYQEIESDIREIILKLLSNAQIKQNS